MAVPTEDELNLDDDTVEENIDIVESSPLGYSPTENPMRPRAILMGYVKNPDKPGFGTILVVFRDSEDRLYEYRNVPQDMWDAGDGENGLKNAPSTGKFLQGGLDTWEDKGWASGYGGTTYSKITRSRMKAFGIDYSETKSKLRRPSEFKKATGRRRGLL